MTYDYLQWLRFIQVIVGKNGKGLDVRASHADGLRIEATIEKSILPTPNTADVTIYNLDPESENLVLKEFDEVIVNAGYAKRLPTIDDDPNDPSLYEVLTVFRGQLKHSFAGFKSGDRKVDIQAADGEKDYRKGVTRVVLEAGQSDADAVAAALEAMPNTKAGHIQTSARKLIRGKVLIEPARDTLARAAANNDAFWSHQDGVLHMVPSAGVLPTEAVVLNYETGLLDSPEISDKGIQVTSLLNPLILPNGRVKLNNGDMQVQTFQLYTSGPKFKERKLVRTTSDGVYKVFKMRHEIDSLGKCRTVSHCLAPGDRIPTGSQKKPVVRL